MDRPFNLLDVSQENIQEMLKNLPNLYSFMDKVTALTGEDRPGVVMFKTDMHRLKAINDELGHDAGDKAILATYQALEDSLAAGGQSYAIGRAHGDEFAAMILGDRSTAEKVIQTVIRKLNEVDFAALSGDSRTLAIKIGAIAAAPGSYENLWHVYDATDAVLMEACKDGKFGWRVVER